MCSKHTGSWWIASILRELRVGPVRVSVAEFNLEAFDDANSDEVHLAANFLVGPWQREELLIR
jgi:hypothetical protein